MALPMAWICSIAYSDAQNPGTEGTTVGSWSVDPSRENRGNDVMFSSYPIKSLTPLYQKIVILKYPEANVSKKKTFLGTIHCQKIDHFRSLHLKLGLSNGGIRIKSSHCPPCLQSPAPLARRNDLVIWFGIFRAKSKMSAHPKVRNDEKRRTGFSRLVISHPAPVLFLMTGMPQTRGLSP